MANEYRIDLIDCAQPKRVPCGMNTIVYLESVKPSETTIKGTLLAAGDHRKVAICSRWYDEIRDYVIFASYVPEDFTN
jgi:hypothetical protein